MDTFTFNGRRNEYGEFVIRCYRDGKRYPDGDYFTDDKQDAINTFNAMTILAQTSQFTTTKG